MDTQKASLVTIKRVKNGRDQHRVRLIVVSVKRELTVFLKFDIHISYSEPCVNISHLILRGKKRNVERSKHQ